MSGEQINLLDEIIVDNFAGGGGASTGIELATGRPVAIAINHDPDAILMHRTNHPYTEHLQASVWDVDPREVCRGRPVGLAWFSPDCKHFSKAKGAALVDRGIRGLAWIVLRWAGTVRPRVIILENVEEFVTWGPVRKGKPVKKKAGQTFQKWKRQLLELGYQVEHREIVAADLGAPTTRKRFVLVARCDGRPIVWPERTHGPRDSEEVRDGRLLPWKSAAEIIDWSVPCYSVFASKRELKEKYGVNAVRPLADNTMRRVIRGVDKFTIRSGRPFVVECNHGGDGHARADGEPLNTITRKYTGGLCDPLLAPFTFSNTGGSVGADVSEPVRTIRTAGGQIMASANLIQYHTEQTERVRANGLRMPLPTVDASNRYGLTTAQLVEYFGNGQPIDVRKPMHTVTSHDREAIVCAHICKYYGGVIGAEAQEPLPTVTAVDHNAVAAAHIVEFKGQDIGQDAGRPLRTITASAGEFADCRAELIEVGGQDLMHWPEVRDLLNRHCGYEMADDEILLLEIGRGLYFIADILLRMLTPRELYNSMGFPPDYIIDRDYLGNEYGKTKQVARCGNAVCPPMATALVRANLPEWCNRTITTMEELEKAVAV
jgi:DNA (cytosine-5)-methyltransferase 1